MGFNFSPAFPGIQFLEFPKKADKEFHPIFKSGFHFRIFSRISTLFSAKKTVFEVSFVNIYSIKGINILQTNALLGIKKK
jgi:hypothetical protein